jgi:hypothetical protein
MGFTVQQKVQCCYWLVEFKFLVTAKKIQAGIWTGHLSDSAGKERKQ